MVLITPVFTLQLDVTNGSCEKWPTGEALVKVMTLLRQVGLGLGDMGKINITITIRTFSG